VWEIIQYETIPLIPSMTKFMTVLGPMKNVPITTGFVEKYVNLLDTHQKAFWDREEKATRAVYEERAAQDRWREEAADRAHKAILGNPDLMERVSRNGLAEMELGRLRRHIPNYKF
jgi:hypothetical protein